MKITVRFFATLRDLVGDWSIDFSFPNDIRTKEVLEFLAERFGDKFRQYVYDERGSVRDYLIFLLNGESIHALNGFETKLKESDTLVILPPVGGG
jgi:molybdopterin synthase sulfur carrier subunit